MSIWVLNIQEIAEKDDFLEFEWKWIDPAIQLFC